MRGIRAHAPGGGFFFTVALFERKRRFPTKSIAEFRAKFGNRLIGDLPLAAAVVSEH